MMEESGHQEGAINLSTVRESGKDGHTNGDITQNGENGHDPVLPQPPPRIPGKGTPVPALSGAAKRKNKPPADPVAAVAAAMQQTQQQQNLLMLAAQQGLTPQQMQALQQQLVGGSQTSLMQQQQQSLLLQHQQKIHEQAMHQLNEQLQLNILRQSELLQQAGTGDKGKGNSKAMQQQLQQLAVQQQQLVQQIQQIQLQQRQYLLACLVQPFGMPQGMMSPAEMQQLWKEVAAQSGLEENTLKTLNGLTLPSPPTSTANGQATHLHSPNFLANGSLPLEAFSLPGSTGKQEGAGNDGSKLSFSARDRTSSPPCTALFRHNLCKWPGCDTQCEDYTTFIKHLNMEHQLDDRSTAQARVQLQVVSQLEIQLSREKELLQAMMQHLHMLAPASSIVSSSLSSTSSTAASSAVSSQSLSTSVPLPLPPPPPQPSLVKAPLEPKQEPTTPILPKHHMIPPFTASPFLPAVTMVTSPMVPLPHTPTSQPHLLLTQPPPVPALLSQHSSGSSGGCAGGGVGSSGGGGGGMGGGAGPIRRRVSDKCNLPISTEIQRNREFYKTTDVRPPFTYASLIRQAIIESPHRQLTLNEIYQWFQATFAYFRRNEATWKNAVRHNLSLHKCFMRVENVKGAVWTVDEVEFYKRRPQKLSGGNIKSPSLSDPSSYSETINATIRAALGEASLAMMSQGGQMMDQDTAQDLSIKSISTSSSQDGIMAMARSLGDEEMLVNIKREAGLDPDTPTFLDGPGPDGHLHHPTRIMVPLLQDREGGANNMHQPPSFLGPSPVPADEDMEEEVGGMRQEVGVDEDLPQDDDDVQEQEAQEEEEEYVHVSPQVASDYGEADNMHDDYRDREETSDREMARDRDMMGEQDMTSQEGGRMMAGDEGEGGLQQEGEEESVEDTLREEGPQPGLEADDLMDNLPVFPVPQLQPVTST